MTRKKKIIRNLIIIIVIYLLPINKTGLYLDPIKAHRDSERSSHYGPSEILHIEDFPRGKYILGKYDKWFSCNTINKKLAIFWTFGSGPGGIENDRSKPMSYSWQGTLEDFILFGIVNDERIEKVELTLHTDEVFSQEEFYDDMFLFVYSRDGGTNNFKYLRGYDKEGSIIFETINPMYID